MKTRICGESSTYILSNIVYNKNKEFKFLSTDLRTITIVITQWILKNMLSGKSQPRHTIYHISYKISRVWKSMKKESVPVIAEGENIRVVGE